MGGWLVVVVVDSRRSSAAGGWWLMRRPRTCQPTHNQTNVFTPPPRYADPHTWMTSPALYLFRDESWDKYFNAPACDDKMEFAFKAIPIGTVTRSHTAVLHRGLDEASKT